MISNKQKQYLHQLARQRGIDEPLYRSMIRTATGGRSESCTDMTQSEFDQVLRYLNVSVDDDARLNWEIRRLAEELRATSDECGVESRTPNSSLLTPNLGGICRRMTQGQTTDWESLNRYQKGHLIDALKAIIGRAKKRSRHRRVSDQPLTADR